MIPYAKVLACVVGALSVGLAIFNAVMGTQGDESYLLVECWSGPAVFVVVTALSYRANVNAIRHGTMTKKGVIAFYLAVLCSCFLAYQITWRYLVPSDIRMEFDNSERETQSLVQFYFRQNGRWLEGPSVEGFPLHVSFPDLDRDGHHDIKVTHIVNGEGSIELLYLPRNDGRVFWRLVSQKYAGDVHYPPAGLYGGP